MIATLAVALREISVPVVGAGLPLVELLLRQGVFELEDRLKIILQLIFVTRNGLLSCFIEASVELPDSKFARFTLHRRILWHAHYRLIVAQLELICCGSYCSDDIFSFLHFCTFVLKIKVGRPQMFIYLLNFINQLHFFPLLFLV